MQGGGSASSNARAEPITNSTGASTRVPRLDSVAWQPSAVTVFEWAGLERHRGRGRRRAWRSARVRSLSSFDWYFGAGWFGSWISMYAISVGLIPWIRNRPSASVTASRFRESRIGGAKASTSDAGTDLGSTKGLIVFIDQAARDDADIGRA